MATPGAVQDPHRSYDLLQQGLGQAQQAVNQYTARQDAKAAQTRPLHPDLDSLMQHSLQRIQNGEDPVAVANEVKQYPELPKLIQQRLAGGQPQGAPQAPTSLGAAGGSAMGPAMQAPQAPPQAAPSGVAPQSLGGMGPGFNPVQMAQPLGGPVVSPQSVGAMGSAPQPPPQPAPMPQAAPPQAAAPARRAFTSQDLNDYQQIAPMLLAQQSKQEIARVTLEAKRQIAEMQAQNAQLLAELRAKGVSEKLIADAQKATEGNKTKVEVAKIGAGARTAAAGISAGASRDVAQTRAAATEKKGGNEGQKEREKELRSVQSALATQSGNPTSDPAEVRRLQTRLGELQRMLGVEGPSTPGPLLGPAAPGVPTFPNSMGPGTAPSAPKAAPPASVAPKSGKIRVRLKDGRTGMVDAAHFNPATMTKL